MRRGVAAWICSDCGRSDGRYGCRPKICGARARLQAGMPIEQLGALAPRAKAAPKPKPPPAMSPPHAIANPPAAIAIVIHGHRLKSYANRTRGNTKLAALITSREHHTDHEAGRLATTRVIERDGLPRLPLLIEITRVAPALLDDDNLAGAAKYLRDGIAAAIGLDDRDARVKFEPKQVKRGRGNYDVEIRISTRSA